MRSPLSELDDVSPDVARKLIDLLFRQVSVLIIGGLIFVLLGVVGFIGTGSRWYLGGSLLSGSICGWRVRRALLYAASDGSVPPATWARRSLCDAWLTGLGWGAWSAVVLFEPARLVLVGVICAMSSCVIGAVVRSSALSWIAEGQIFCTMTPLVLACLASGDFYLVFYAFLLALQIAAALGLSRFLRRQTIRLLQQDEEKAAFIARLESAQHELRLANQHLEWLAATDPLTGIANRRTFELACAREWLRCGREQAALSMLMLDVDHFKQYNDCYGHQAGDACLQRVASVIGSVIRRQGHLLARYGGEEFVVVMPATELAAAARIGEQILAALADLAMPHAASVFGHVTVSIGAACMMPGAVDESDRLTALADAALYTAKSSGRNVVRTAPAMPPEMLTPETLAPETLAPGHLARRTYSAASA